jgi:glycolate oxidase FAD binding subunit
LLQHEAGDLVCTAEAAMPMAELQEAVARHGQMLALDPPGADRLTVGEVFDGGLFGPRAHRYGRPRDLILGVTVRLADGLVARGGGRVVKNVAGYDLPKLFTGARGRLGELLELTVRLHPLPAATASVVAPIGDVKPLEPLAPACVEGLWPQDLMRVRFESPAAHALAERAQALIGGEVVEDDEELWAGHREMAVEMQMRYCPAGDSRDVAERLMEDGATQVVGRLARGWLASDVLDRARPAPTPLESAVIASLGSA